MNTYIYSRGDVTIRVHAASEDQARVMLTDKIAAAKLIGFEIPDNAADYELVAAY